METWECIHYGCGHYSSVCTGSTHGHSMPLWAQGSQGNQYGCIYHWSMLWVFLTLCHTYLIACRKRCAGLSDQFWQDSILDSYIKHALSQDYFDSWTPNLDNLTVSDGNTMLLKDYYNHIPWYMAVQSA